MLCSLSTLSIRRSKHAMHSMLYVEAVDTKHIHTFLSITSLIFNKFSIRKKFWKAETEGFSTIPSNTIYVDTVDTRQGSLLYSMLCMSTLSTLGISISNAFLLIIFLRSHPNSLLCVCRHCQQTT